MVDVSGHVIFENLVGDSTSTGSADSVSSLTDTVIGEPLLDNQALAYDTATSKWINQTLAGGGGATNLADLGDVTITSVSDHEIISYDTATGKWVNEALDKVYLRIYNNTGAQLDAGSVVYITGSHNQNIFYVDLAMADSATTMPSMGILKHDVANGAEDLAVIMGKAQGLDTSLMTAGDIVYVSPTVAGGITTTKPSGGTHLIQNLGVVSKVHASNGVITVTSVGRANDIPNAVISTDTADVDYLYIDDGGTFKKISKADLDLDHGGLQGLSDDDHAQYIYTNPTTALRNRIHSAATGANNLVLKAAQNQSGRFIKLENDVGVEVGYFAPDGALSSLSVASPNIDAQTNMSTPAIQGGVGTFDSVAVTGNVTVTGTVDGRDVATDGTTQDSHIAQADIHFTEVSIDHGNIQNHGTKTHTVIDNHIDDGNIHYLQTAIDHTVILNKGTNTHAEIDTHIDSSPDIHFIVGSIDHGSIAGLGDDDHTQYTLANGTRAMTKLDVTGVGQGITVADGNVTVTGGLSATVDVSSALIKGVAGDFGNLSATGTLDVTGATNLASLAVDSLTVAGDVNAIYGDLTVKQDILIDGVVDGVDIANLSTNYTNHHTGVSQQHAPFTSVKDGFVPNPATVSTDHHFLTAAGNWKARPNEYLELTTSADTVNGGTAVATTIDNWETTTYIKDSATTWVFDDTDITLPYTGIYEITLKLYFQKDTNGVHEHMIWIEEDGGRGTWAAIEKSYAAGLNRAGSTLNPSESSSTSTILWSGTAGDLIRARFEVNNTALDEVIADRSTILIKRIDT